MTTIKIQSVPKNSPEGVLPREQKWSYVDILTAREIISSQRQIHQKKSKWFKIFKNDQLVFDSNLIHS